MKLVDRLSVLHAKLTEAMDELNFALGFYVS